MTTYDLNRLWLTIASENAEMALRQTDASRVFANIAANSDFSAPLSHHANAKSHIVEAA
jgi:hypothetical protein